MWKHVQVLAWMNVPNYQLLDMHFPIWNIYLLDYFRCSINATGKSHLKNIEYNVGVKAGKAHVYVISLLFPSKIEGKVGPKMCDVEVNLLPLHCIYHSHYSHIEWTWMKTTLISKGQHHHSQSAINKK